MIVFAALSTLVIIAVACVGLICAHYSADDLRNMGIRQ
jgi:hypothetical protein